MNTRKIEKEVEDKAAKALEELKTIKDASKREVHETYLASEILLKLGEGKEVPHDQIIFLKEQSVDFAKALALIGLQAVPGSSLAIIAIEKIGKKHGFTIFPQAQKDPEL